MKDHMEDHMEEKSGMQKSDRVRFTLFIVLHIAFCTSVFLCTMGLDQFIFADVVSGTQSDATGFSDLMNFIGVVYKGILAVFLYIVCVAAMLVWSAFLVILLRFAAIKKDTRVTGYEVKATMAVTVAGVIVTLAVGMLFMGTEILEMMGILLLPIVILEITVYWTGLWGRKRSGDLQNLSLEHGDQAAKGDPKAAPKAAPKEEKRMLRAAHIARFTVFVVIHIVLCVLVFCYAKQAGEIGTVDGTDYTRIGIADLLGGAFYTVAMLVWSAVLLTPLRFIAVRKNSRVTELEVKGTLAAAVAGGILSLIMGAICMGIGALVVMAMMFVPVLILEIAMYWIGLREKQRI